MPELNEDQIPQPDGTYPDFRWRGRQKLDEDEKKGQEKAEALVGFSLKGWLNKAYFVFSYKDGVMKAIWLHDYSWYIITTSDAAMIQQVIGNREITAKSAEKWLEEVSARSKPAFQERLDTARKYLAILKS